MRHYLIAVLIFISVMNEVSPSVSTNVTNRITILMSEIIDNREAMHLGEPELNEKYLYLPLNFAVNLKVL